MRVLQLLKTSAGANWALVQCTELVRRGVEVHVAAPPGGPLLERARAAGIQIHEAQFDFPVRQLWRLRPMITALRALVREVDPDVVHSHFVGTTLTMRAALRGHDPRPRIFQVPGPLHLENGFFRRAEIASAGPDDRWVASCRWTQERYLRDGIPPDRVHLSYYGVDFSTIRRRPAGALRRELGLSPDTRIVGMVAYMYAPKRYLGQRRGLKGHEDLIDALALVRRRSPNVIAVMVGGAWNHAVQYEAAVRRYGALRCPDGVVFLGSRTDVPSLYADFDVVCHPSLSENVGGAAESLALGVPTIATRVGGFPDVVVDGETGWLVPPANPPALAEAIEDALRDPDEALRRTRRGEARIRQIFDVADTAAGMHAIYCDAVAAGRSAAANERRSARTDEAHVGARDADRRRR